MEGREPERIRLLVIDVIHVYLLIYLSKQMSIRNPNFVSKAAFSEERNLQSLLKVQKNIVTIKTATASQSNTRNSVGLVRGT